MSVHEIDFAAQNHKNREHGPGHPLLPLCGNSPFYTVSPFRVGRGALTPPQTQIVGETVVSRQSKSAAPEGVALVVCGGGKALGKPHAAQRSGRAVRREQPSFVRENVHNVQKSSLTADDGFLCADAYRFHEVAE